MACAFFHGAAAAACSTRQNSQAVLRSTPRAGRRSTASWSCPRCPTPVMAWSRSSCARRRCRRRMRCGHAPSSCSHAAASWAPCSAAAAQTRRSLLSQVQCGVGCSWCAQPGTMHCAARSRPGPLRLPVGHQNAWSAVHPLPPLLHQQSAAPRLACCRQAGDAADAQPALGRVPLPHGLCCQPNRPHPPRLLGAPAWGCLRPAGLGPWCSALFGLVWCGPLRDRPLGRRARGVCQTAAQQRQQQQQRACGAQVLHP